MAKKNVVILGSTGSIGVNTLKVIERFPQKFNVVGLTAYSNCKLLEKQIQKFLPEYVAVNPNGCEYIRKAMGKTKVKILDVYSDLESLVSFNKVDCVVIGMRGSAALKPFLAAARSGKIIAPANKEALVIAGNILMEEAKKHGAKIVPVDSEQSAIFQCLEGRNKKDLKRVLLTASGGVLLNVEQSKFDSFSVEEILKHPRWKMGEKITVDSATLMNKGFELIETMRLFDLKADQIDVIIHPEAIIHSMVEFLDGSIIAQLGITDMRLPIQYAISHPERLDTGLKSLDFFKLKQLNFQKPDLKKFPSLALAMYVAEKDGTYPSVLNAADEEIVDAFIQKKIKFTDIFRYVEKIISKHKNISNPTLSNILDADCWARDEARRLI